MTDLIRVQPATGRRRDFAAWAVQQQPKIRTIGLHLFGVPPHLFVQAPEHLLIGSVIDGHRYVSPDEPQAPPGAELLGVATPEALTPAAGVSGADGGDGTGPGDFAPLEDAPVEPQEGEGEAPFACDLCPRTFETSRGRDTHRRQAHRED